MVLCRWWLARPALVFASRTGGVLATAVPWRLVLPTYPSLGVFWVLMSLMHVSEYIATAMYRRDLSLNSFLINHSAAYHGAIAAGVGEYLVTRWLWPGCKDSMGAGAWLAAAGALSMLAVRVAAMVTAGNNFRHLIAETRERDHQLVTRGVYAVLRHPAYTSFFYFGPCLQLVLGNRLCVIAYVVVLWRFFADRIPYEEELLIEFFGDQYTAYRQKTRTWIPFIP
ncbi:hypothetical protein CXG81DRAFT_8486 [Caulochytrium protostelioides]|uniref:Protein-S-isoprenylcysteine O-methyltransferase n=1 Tax=Caulochytrium protostelioides TaxID=1555241 RepID=A0A4P9XFI5_9FUNG|nr:hypothetical protein CXG81DRAFT_8486 [Caulochytrium protostelioides]|eukprot:RKP04318.1 hypothetical protein CXG81DRAFT_8486 [Caulochytrium protostelioides]